MTAAPPKAGHENGYKNKAPLWLWQCAETQTQIFYRLYLNIFKWCVRRRRRKDPAKGMQAVKSLFVRLRVLWEMSWRADKLVGLGDAWVAARTLATWDFDLFGMAVQMSQLWAAVQGRSETLQHTQKCGRFSHSFSRATTGGSKGKRWDQGKIVSAPSKPKLCCVCAVHPLEVKTSRFCSMLTHCNSCLYREIWFVTFNVLYFHIMALWEGGTREVGGSVLLTKLQKNIISVHLKSTSIVVAMHWT